MALTPEQHIVRKTEFRMAFNYFLNNPQEEDVMSGKDLAKLNKLNETLGCQFIASIELRPLYKLAAFASNDTSVSELLLYLIK